MPAGCAPAAPGSTPVRGGNCPVPATLGNIPVRESSPDGRASSALATGKTPVGLSLLKSEGVDGIAPIAPVCQPGSKRLRGVKSLAGVEVPEVRGPLAVLLNGMPAKTKELRNASTKSWPQG